MVRYLRTNYKKTCLQERWDYMLKILLIILCSIVNIIGIHKPIRSFNKKGNFQFDNGVDILFSPKNHEENGYGRMLDTPNISH